MKIVQDIEYDELYGMPENKAFAVCTNILNNAKHERKIRFFGKYTNAVIQFCEDIKLFKQKFSLDYYKNNYVGGYSMIKSYQGTLNPVFFESLNDLLELGDEGSNSETQNKIIKSAYSMFSRKEAVANFAPLEKWSYEHLELMASLMTGYMLNAKNPLVETMMPVLVNEIYKEALKKNKDLVLNDDELKSYQKDLYNGLVQIAGEENTKSLINFTMYCEDNISYMAGEKTREPLLLLTEREYDLLEYQKRKLLKGDE